MILIWKMWNKIRKCGKFAVTVLATLPIRTASQGGSFAFIAFPQILYTPQVFSDYPGKKHEGFL